MRDLIEKLREKEWACRGLMPQPLFLKWERTEGKQRKYYGGDGDRPRVQKSEKMQVPCLI